MHLEDELYKKPDIIKTGDYFELNGKKYINTGTGKFLREDMIPGIQFGCCDYGILKRYL